MSAHDYTRLDAVIHSRIRLAVMATLASADEAEFTFLRERTGATDGNLATHLRKLEQAGYVRVKKSFVRRKPVSRYALTAHGREAFTAYVKQLEGLLGTVNL
jgi:DNA-binding MarR family transcriptional regulator